jgi:hypothetical protein
MSPSTTPPGIRYPDGSRIGFCLLAWSPPLVHALISLRPLGFPVPRRFHRVTPPAIVRDPHPSGGSRPAVPPLARFYSNARVHHPPVALRTRTPHPTRFRSSVRGAANRRALPVRWHSVPHRGYPTPMYRPELCARPGVSAFASPPVPLPPVTLGSLGPRGPAGFPRHPVSVHGPQRWACGAPATGFAFPRSPAAGEDGVDTTPPPTPLSEHAARALPL